MRFDDVGKFWQDIKGFQLGEWEDYVSQDQVLKLIGLRPGDDIEHDVEVIVTKRDAFTRDESHRNMWWHRRRK